MPKLGKFEHGKFYEKHGLVYEVVGFVPRPCAVLEPVGQQKGDRLCVMPDTPFAQQFIRLYREGDHNAQPQDESEEAHDGDTE